MTQDGFYPKQLSKQDVKPRDQIWETQYNKKEATRSLNELTNKKQLSDLYTKNNFCFHSQNGLTGNELTLFPETTKKNTKTRKIHETTVSKTKHLTKKDNNDS